MKRPILAKLSAAIVSVGLIAGPALAGGDVEKGKKVFNKCKSCHVADQEKNKIGPYLVGIFGRSAGTLEGFKYSDAMKGSGIVWSPETLTEYLRKPKDFIPGNKMTFVGLKKEEQITDLLAYLQEATQKPQ